jgi:flagellar hook-length control protein FliK
MHIESVVTRNGAAQGQTPGAKSAAANDPLAALFAELLDLADAVAGGDTEKTAKKADDQATAQQLAAMMGGGTFLPLAAAGQSAAQTTTQNGAGKAGTIVTGPAAANPTAGTPATNGAAVPMPLAKGEAAGPASDKATAEAAADDKPAAPGASAAAKPADPAAKPDSALPGAAVALAPTVALAAPKTAAPVGAEKAKPAAAAAVGTKSTTPVSVTVEKAPAQPTEPSRHAETRAPVAAATPEAPKDEPITAAAKPDATPLPPASAAPLQSAQAPVDKPMAPAQPAAVPLHPATEQLVHRVEKAIEHGEDRIRIELKPASLGGVEVHLHIADDGRVSAMVRADRADTLALLQNDVRGLEQALKDAGLRPDAGSLSFNLRQGEGQAGHQPDARGQRRRGSSERTAFAIEAVGAEPSNSRTLLGGLDIRI